MSRTLKDLLAQGAEAAAAVSAPGRPTLSHGALRLLIETTLPRLTAKTLVGGSVLADGSVLLLAVDRTLLISRDQGQTFTLQQGSPGRPVAGLMPTPQVGTGVLVVGADGTRTPNFNSDELAALTKNLSAEYTPEDILDYIYAILHSPSYRQKYKEFLKIDFPRVPIIKSDAEFARLIPLGKRLRELHLMKASDIDNYETTFPEAGDDTVDKLRYEDGKVYINDSQYFGNVPELAWNFYIGGYQPAQKWLKDRRTRKLKSDDTTHYQRIIKILIETNNVMHEIDVTNE